MKDTQSIVNDLNQSIKNLEEQIQKLLAKKNKMIAAVRALQGVTPDYSAKIKQGMVLAKKRGKHIGRKAWVDIDPEALMFFRSKGESLSKLAKRFNCARATISRELRKLRKE